MTNRLPEHLSKMVGRVFPGGEYVIEPYRAWLMTDAVEDDPDPSVVHPVHAWLGATEGMGISWDELFIWFDATAADGPMIGDHESQIHQPLRVNQRYRVSGNIVSVDRKRGKSVGTFDLVRYSLELHDEADDPVATCRNSVIFPRSDR